MISLRYMCCHLRYCCWYNYTESSAKVLQQESIWWHRCHSDFQLAPLVNKCSVQAMRVHLSVHMEDDLVIRRIIDETYRRTSAPGYNPRGNLADIPSWETYRMWITSKRNRSRLSPRPIVSSRVNGKAPKLGLLQSVLLSILYWS